MHTLLIRFHTLNDEVDAIDNVERDKMDPCLLIEFESKPFSISHFCNNTHTHVNTCSFIEIITLLASMPSIQLCFSSTEDALKKYVQSCTLMSNRKSSNS